jgi:hypothetical protein
LKEGTKSLFLWVCTFIGGAMKAKQACSVIRRLKRIKDADKEAAIEAIKSGEDPKTVLSSMLYLNSISQHFAKTKSDFADTVPLTSTGD